MTQPASPPRSVYRKELRDLRPTDRELSTGLRAALGEVEIRRRHAHVFASSFPADVVSVVGPHGPRDVLCKYSAGRSYDTGGHRGGVAYEARIYADVLRRLTSDAPTYFGTYVLNESNLWLFTEFVSDATRADEAPDPATSIRQAASWIARFHVSGALVASEHHGLLVYDGEYYTNWADRTVRFSENWHLDAPWLRDLSKWFVDVGVGRLLNGPLTAIHGEYTPHNVLVQRGRIRPVDWESLAIAAPEIDLASVVEQWPDSVCTAAESDYRASAPCDPLRLEAARVYWGMRWLGHTDDWSRTDRARRRLTWLSTVAVALGIA